MVADKFSCIKELTKTVHIALPPSYISNEISGVTDILESWKRQYNKQLQGIVVSYKNISLTCKSGSIVIDKPYVHYDIKATFELFCPSTGSIVQGKINRVSHDYIGCLVHNTINATIKRISSNLDEISEFIALDRMILFKITCFVYHQKVIKVRGEITEECFHLMKKLAPFNTQSGILQDSSSSYLSTAELSEYNVSTVKDKEKYSQSLNDPISNLKSPTKKKKHKNKKTKDKFFNTTESQKKSTHQNKSPKGHLNNNVTSNDIKEIDVFAASKPNLEEQLHLNDISSSAIKEESIAAIKREKKRKRKSLDKVICPSKKKKTEGDKAASGKNKDKVKKKGKSKKVKNKILKSKKAQSYKIKSRKKKKEKDKSSKNLNPQKIKQNNVS